MALPQWKFCIKWHKEKYFRMIFDLMNIIKIKTLNFNYVIEMVTCTIFNINFS